VRRIGGDVGEERGVLVLDSPHPVHGPGEEDVGAEPARLDERPVVADDGVEVLVVRRVGTTAVVRLPDPARAVDERFVKAAPMRLVGLFVAQVPLAEDAAGIADGLQNLRQRGGVQRHAFAFQNRMRDAVAHRMAARHHGRPRRCAGGTDQKPGEADARVVQLVQVRRLDPRMAVSSDRRVSLIVGDHQDDVRPRSGQRLGQRFGWQGHRDDKQDE
jgi:hypothetical protein